MRRNSEQDAGALREVFCNCCGKKLRLENGVVAEGCVSVEETFGYFSEKDGQTHRFDLCEDCYDKWTAAFQIPVEVSERTEML